MGEIVLSILIICFAVLIIYLMYRIVGAPIRMLTLAVKGWRDYKHSRGTHHRKELRRAIGKVRSEINRHSEQLAQYRKRISNVAARVEEKIRREMTADMVRRMDGVKGIGPDLRDRIIKECFCGTFHSLKKAEKMQGIGLKKIAALQSWIASQEKHLNSIMAHDMQIQQRIAADSASESKIIEEKIEQEQQHLHILRKLEHCATSHAESLFSVNILHYYGALLGDRKKQAMVSADLLGIYPPWEHPPVWLSKLRNSNYD